MALGQITHVIRKCSECGRIMAIFAWDLLDWDGKCDECRDGDS